MKRTATTVLAALTLLALVGLLGRAPNHSAPPVHAVRVPDRGEAATGVCGAVAATRVQTRNVNLITSDGHMPDRGGCATPQNEPALAIDPRDPATVVVSGNDFRLCCDFTGAFDSTGWVYVSRDGGVTWANALVRGLTRGTGGRGTFGRFDVSEDPALAFAPDGTLYYVCIVFASDTAASGIAFASSTDGGATWSAPRLLQYTHDTRVFNDKGWVAAGDDGRVAVTWTRFQRDGYTGRAFVEGALSWDGGATWKRPVALSDYVHVASWGATPLWAHDGTLYTVFDTSRALGARDAVSVSLYRPGARLVERDLARVYDDDDCFAVNRYLRQTLTGEAFRISSLPAAAIDPASQTVAIAWADGERGCTPGRTPRATNSQIKLVFVHGTHASRARIVTSGAEKALPSVDYRDGKVVLGYYTRSFATVECSHAGRAVCLDYAYSTSGDGFAAEHRLSDGSSNPFDQFAGTFIGDYSAPAIGPDGVAYAACTDSRGGDQNVFGATFTP